ncbi:MAG: DUF1761 domain-containing protein [Bacteroidota bacterium]
MLNVLASINWLSVLTAFAAYFILGALWFTALFSKPYLLSLGKANEIPQKTAPIFIIGPAICTLVITIAAAILMYALNISNIGDALAFGLVIGLGFLFANTVNIAINPNIPRPLLYGLISGMYHLAGISLACTVLVLMK